MLNRVLRRRQAEEEVKNMGRLPPGQSLTNKFPVLHYGPTPYYETLDNWDLRIYGEVMQDKVWNWQAFNNLPRQQVKMDIHCVTRWSKFDTVWEGISLKTLIDAGFIEPLPGARFVVQHCDYDYTTNLPLDVMLQDNVLLATHFDGQPLTREHGYPLRVIIGSFADRSEDKSAYFWKGGKWLRGLEFRQEDQPGFWERSGYHNEGDPWTEQRFGRF